jgi:proteic killer suppression protein
MIKSFKSKALKLFWEKDDTSKVQPGHIRRVGYILQTLHGANGPDGMMLPGFKTHPLKGDRKGDWASTVQANWRITYRFEGGNATLIDYEDYHGR